MIGSFVRKVFVSLLYDLLAISDQAEVVTAQMLTFFSTWSHFSPSRLANGSQTSCRMSMYATARFCNLDSSQSVARRLFSSLS